MRFPFLSVLQRGWSRLPSAAFLWLAIAIFGASGAVTRRLSQLGADHYMDGRNPISLCNVLFVGNLCALVVLLLLYGHEGRWRNLRRLTGRDWGVLLAIAALAGAIAPGLIFDALARTQLNNIILIGRLEPPLVLALSVWFLGERVNAWLVSGAIVSLVGVVATVLFQALWEGMDPQVLGNLGLGELFVALAAIAAASATILIKTQPAYVTLGLSSIVRTAFGTLVFAALALIFYGTHHFRDAFSPFLWRWMLLYGTVIVVVGQSFWFTGLRRSSVAQASLVSSFTPVAGLLAAYWVLGEAPTAAQYLGGSLIIAGLVLSQIGTQRQLSGAPQALPQGAQTVDSEVGFKGI